MHIHSCENVRNLLFSKNFYLLECNKEVGGTAELKSEIIEQTANTHEATDTRGVAYLEGEAEDQHTR